MLSQSYHDDSLLKAILSTESFPSPVCSHLVEQPGRDIAKVFLLQLVLFATGSIDADVLERIDDTLNGEAHFHEPVDHVPVVAVVCLALALVFLLLAVLLVCLLRAFNAASSSPPEEPAPVRPEPAEGLGALAYLIAHSLAT
jgi:hypothetical protein